MAKEVDVIVGMLRKRDRSPTRGVLKSIRGNVATVVTDMGTVLSTISGSEGYEKGQRVILNDGMIVKKVGTKKDDTDIYIV